MHTQYFQKILSGPHTGAIRVYMFKLLLLKRRRTFALLKANAESSTSPHHSKCSLNTSDITSHSTTTTADNAEAPLSSVTPSGALGLRSPTQLRAPKGAAGHGEGRSPRWQRGGDATTGAPEEHCSFSISASQVRGGS